MTGAEAAALRTRLGYTQGQLAERLQVSTPTVSRHESKAEVPPAYAAQLQALPPAPATPSGRGAYRREPEKPTPLRQPPPLRARASTAPTRAPASPVPSPPQPAARAEELPILNADAAGAVLLEGSGWIAAYWIRVTAARQLVLVRQRHRKEGRLPCRS